MNKILVITLVLMTIFTMGFSRTVVYELDGEITLHSITGDSTTKTGMFIQGKGTVAGEIENGERYVFSLESLKRIDRLVAGFMLDYDNEDERVHRMLVSPDGGEKAIIDIDYIGGRIESFVSDGRFANYVRYKNAASGVEVEETVTVEGFSYYRELLGNGEK